jgi:hypothetical protein
MHPDQIKRQQPKAGLVSGLVLKKKKTVPEQQALQLANTQLITFSLPSFVPSFGHRRMHACKGLGRA